MKFLKKIVSIIVKLFAHKVQVKQSGKTETNTEKICHATEIILSAITDEEAIEILNVIRPLVKELNRTIEYRETCEVIADAKKLKTFSNLSEDKTTLSIQLTQSPTFNEKIAGFIKEHVAGLIKNQVNTNLQADYDISTENGVIIINKRK